MQRSRPPSIRWRLRALLVLLMVGAVWEWRGVAHAAPLSIDNGQVSVTFDPDDGRVRIGSSDGVNSADAWQCEGATARINAWESCTDGWIHAASVRPLRGRFGGGQALLIQSRHHGQPTLLLELRIDKDRTGVEIRGGLINSTTRSLRVTSIAPLGVARLDGAATRADTLRVLSGEAGGGETTLSARTTLNSPNNLLLFDVVGAAPHALVAGGLSYAEFGKYVEFGRTSAATTLTLLAADPVGRIVQPGERYLPEQDAFYLDVVTRDPFEALETYAQAVRRAMNAHPTPYTFPTVCLWYAMHHTYGNGPAINTSTGAVEEMQRIAASGFLRYAPAAVRLVPDFYGADNQQGWWDDAHWQRYGPQAYMLEPGRTNPLPSAHYTAPYETTEKWVRAVQQAGGLAESYVQPGMPSRDYLVKYPGHALGNDATPLLAPDAPEVHRSPITYDYTDAAFRAHVATVWRRLRQAGVSGVMFDYPHLAWRPAGGFEDSRATCAAAYRAVFALAKRGLGNDSRLNERNVKPGAAPFLDLTVGLVDSQRVWRDTDRATAAMYRRCALRWYKARTLYAYDMDAKHLGRTEPANRDGVRQVLTMSYLVGGRLLLATSFARLTPAQLRDMTRVFPMHEEARSARPLDLFLPGVDTPRIYDFAIDSDWHQLAFYNPDTTRSATVSVRPAATAWQGGMGLDGTRAYHVYDFWNDCYRGKWAGNGEIQQTLRPGEVRMMAVRAALDHPQVLSSDRHLMQGWLELHDVRWNASRRRLSGQADVIGGDPLKLVLTINGRKPMRVHASGATAELDWLPATEKGAERLATLTLRRHENGRVRWWVEFGREQWDSAHSTRVGGLP